MLLECLNTHNIRDSPTWSLFVFLAFNMNIVAQHWAGCEIIFVNTDFLFSQIESRK